MATTKDRPTQAGKRGVAKHPAGFTAEEKQAMRERGRELKASSRRRGQPASGESQLLEAIAAMPEPDRSMATRIHAIVRECAPLLQPRTWYGMPAYANDAEQVVCFFQPRSKFKTRYATLGFSDKATLDDGVMWPTAFALGALDRASEARIAEWVARATGALATATTGAS